MTSSNCQSCDLAKHPRSLRCRWSFPKENQSLGSPLLVAFKGKPAQHQHVFHFWGSRPQKSGCLLRPTCQAYEVLPKASQLAVRQRWVQPQSHSQWVCLKFKIMAFVLRVLGPSFFELAPFWHCLKGKPKGTSILRGSQILRQSLLVHVCCISKRSSIRLGDSSPGVLQWLVTAGVPFPYQPKGGPFAEAPISGFGSDRTSPLCFNWTAHWTQDGTGRKGPGSLANKSPDAQSCCLQAKQTSQANGSERWSQKRPNTPSTP